MSRAGLCKLVIQFFAISLDQINSLGTAPKNGSSLPVYGSRIFRIGKILTVVAVLTYLNRCCAIRIEY